MNDSVSVIITHFNKARYLFDAIDSAVRQTLTPHEIIVVDDASEMAQRLSGERTTEQFGGTWLQHDENRGASAARNTGLRHASGQWIQFVDGDDFLPLDSIEVRMAELRAKPGALWCGGPVATIPWFVRPSMLISNGWRWVPGCRPRAEPFVKPDDVPADAPWKVNCHHMAILYHRSLFEDYGLYDEQVPIGEDKELRWRFWYFSKSTPLLVDEPVYYYRRGVRNQLTSRRYYGLRMSKRPVLMENKARREREGITAENTPLLVRTREDA